MSFGFGKNGPTAKDEGYEIYEKQRLESCSKQTIHQMAHTLLEGGGVLDMSGSEPVCAFLITIYGTLKSTEFG